MQRLDTKKLFYSCFFIFSERRVVFDYEKYGDTPACLGEIEDLADQMAISQGFGLTEDDQDGIGNFLETNVTIISNQECYDTLDDIIRNSDQGYSLRKQIQNTVYDGITDQILCTKGEIVEKPGICRKNKVTGRTRCTKPKKIISVCFFSYLNFQKH